MSSSLTLASSTHSRIITHCLLVASCSLSSKVSLLVLQSRFLVMIMAADLAAVVNDLANKSFPVPWGPVIKAPTTSVLAVLRFDG